MISVYKLRVYKYTRNISHQNFRSTIEKLYPAQVKERTTSLESPTSATILEEFEEFGQQLEKDQTKGKTSTKAPRGFVWGVLTTLGVVFVSTLDGLFAIK